MTLPIAQRGELSDFLRVEPKPLAPPWTRLFLRSTQIDGMLWSHAGAPCPNCEQHELLFVALLYPVQDPYEATLCIGCGATMTRHFIDGRIASLHGGDDWATPDNAVGALRRGVRARAEAPEEQDWQGLF